MRTELILRGDTSRKLQGHITVAEIQHASRIFGTIIPGYDYELRQFVTTFLFALGLIFLWYGVLPSRQSLFFQSNTQQPRHPSYASSYCRGLRLSVFYQEFRFRVILGLRISQKKKKNMVTWHGVFWALSAPCLIKYARHHGPYMEGYVSSCRVWRLYTKDYFIVWTRESSGFASFFLF